MLSGLKGINVVWLSKTDLTNINAGEGETNLIDVKKYKKEGIEHPYVSGQAMRFYLKEAIRRNLKGDEFACIPDDQGVPSCLKTVEKMEDYKKMWKTIIKKCLCCNLFGFMKPFGEKGAVIRVSPVKVSPAMGLLPFDENATLDFLTRQKITEVGVKTGGDIVNVEIGTNIYKCGIAVDVRRVGAEEDWSEGSVKIDTAMDDEKARMEGVKKVLEGVKFMADYSKQARLLTDFTPDVVCISFQRKYSHRLQKLFEFQTENGGVVRKLKIERVHEILADVKGYSDKIFFGMISGVIENEQEVKKAFSDHGIEIKTPDKAIEGALSQLTEIAKS